MAPATRLDMFSLGNISPQLSIFSLNSFARIDFVLIFGRGPQTFINLALKRAVHRHLAHILNGHLLIVEPFHSVIHLDVQ